MQNVEDEESRLFAAITNRDLLGIEEALGSGANVNMKNRTNDTLMHEAAMLGFDDVVKLLIKHGADLEAIDDLECTPLVWAAARGHSPVVFTLLKNGANVNAIGTFGNTPLHEATRHAHQDTAKLLIENGANVNIRDSDSLSPLDHIRNPIERAKLSKLARLSCNGQNR